MSGLWRTTTFRLSTLYGAIFAAGIVLLLGLVYVQTAAYLTQRVDRALTAEAGALARSGPDAILQRFERDAAREPLNRFGLYSATGEPIRGQAALPPGAIEDGRPRALAPAPGEPPRRGLVERLPWGEVLVVERDTRQLVELRRIILHALVWSGAVIAVLGLGLAMALSVRPLRRIQAMQAASRAVIAGDFALRLPTDGSRDELDQLAAMVNAMMDELERLIVQARTVGEGVAHELRTPLTRLRALLERAAGALDADDPRRPLMERCVDETDAVLARFRALLRIAAVEARSRRAGVAVVALAPLLDQVAELYAPLAAERGIGLLVEAPDTPVEIAADGELLFEALSNLTDNAIKFSPPHDQVRLTLTGTAHGPLVEVADRGPGIAEAERTLVTKRFYRVQGAPAPGHGLGLSLVAAVADLHGFRLSFHDAHPGTIVRLLCGSPG